MPRHQRRRRVGPELVGRHPYVAAKLQHVAEAAGGEQRGARALALDDRVGDQGGGVRDAAGAGDVLGVDGAERPQAFEDADRGVRRSRQALLDVDGAGALVVQDEVGERAPDVAAQPIRRPRLAHRSLPDLAHHRAYPIEGSPRSDKACAKHRAQMRRAASGSMSASRSSGRPCTCGHNVK